MLQNWFWNLNFLSKTKHGQHKPGQTLEAKSSPLILPLLALSMVVLGIGSGLVATYFSPTTALVVIGCLIISPIAFARPDFMILLILAMTSTIIDLDSLPALGGFSAAEVCLLFLSALVVTKILLYRGQAGFIRTPLDWPIFLFFIIGTLSNLNGIYFLRTVDLFRNEIWRFFLIYMMIFFVVTNLVRTRQQLFTLIGGMFVMATIVAILMIVQQAVGTQVSIIPGQEQVMTATAVGQVEMSGVARVSIAGAIIVYVMLLPAFILHVTPEYLETRKWLSFLPVALFPLAIIFTFDRNMWIGGVIGSIVFILASRFQSQRFIFQMLALAVGVILLVSLLNVYFPRINTVVDGVVARFSSLFAGDELVYDSSTQWRLRENETAILKMIEYPILGVGLGAQWRIPWSDADRLTRFIHNGYYFLILDTGAIGFGSFLLFTLIYLYRGFFYWYKLKDRVLAAVVMGFTLSYIALLVSNTAAPWFFTIYGVPLIGAIIGINEVAIRLEQSSSY